MTAANHFLAVSRRQSAVRIFRILALLNLYDLSYSALEAHITAWNESPAHTRTLWRWLYRTYPTTFDINSNACAYTVHRRYKDQSYGIGDP